MADIEIKTLPALDLIILKKGKYNLWLNSIDSIIFSRDILQNIIRVLILENMLDINFIKATIAEKEENYDE